MNLTVLGVTQMALTALMVASLPLSIVFASRDVNKYRKLAWVTLFLTFDLVVFGGFTRLTDSGLGCPDWPGCYGHANPLQASAEIQNAQAAMPAGPVTDKKAWIEMIHRYLATALGVLILAMICISCWKRFWRKDKSSEFHPAWPLGLLALIAVQAMFGKWTVTMLLQPIIVTTHLLLGLSLLAALGWNYARLDTAIPVAPRARALRHAALLALILLTIQIALGGWVSTNYATLACDTFPLCHGQLVPDMNFTDGFTPWRALGRTANGDYLPLDALTAIHWAHRNFAFVAIAAVAYVAWRATMIAGMERLGRRLMAVLAIQFATGISTIFFQFPLLLAVLHNAGAALLVALLVMLNYRSHNAPLVAGPA